jgi:F0F1-type ATP synthase assembly protein I
MAQIMVRTWGLALLGGVLGALLGYGLELMLGQAGWALICGSMGLCAGAVFAGDRATAPPAPAAGQSPAAQPAAADDEAQTPDQPEPAAPVAPAPTE